MSGFLGRLADKIQPTDKELADAGQLPEHSRAARMIRQAIDIPDMPCVDVVTVTNKYGKETTVRTIKPRTGAPEPTRKGIKTLDGKQRVFFTDGSLRGLAKRLTRKEKKALKRRRHAR